MGPDSTWAYFRRAVNKRPTHLWPGYFLSQPNDIFLTRRGKKSKNLGLLRGNFPNPNQRCLTRHDPSSKKLTRQDPSLTVLINLNTYQEDDYKLYLIDNAFDNHIKGYTYYTCIDNQRYFYPINIQLMSMRKFYSTFMSKRKMLSFFSLVILQFQ